MKMSIAKTRQQQSLTFKQNNFETGCQKNHSYLKYNQAVLVYFDVPAVLKCPTLCPKLSHTMSQVSQSCPNVPLYQHCVWAIQHFYHYLFNHFTVVTDHFTLKWLQTSKMPKGRRALYDALLS